MTNTFTFTRLDYVLGFAFSQGLSQVLVINKTAPEWQVGMLNGVGGKIEKLETPYEAMVREFKEETGRDTSAKEWTRFAELRYGVTKPVPAYEPEIIVHCFTSMLPHFSPRTDNPSGEVARWRSVDTVYVPNYIPNLRWLIPMALLKHQNPAWEEHGQVILM